MEKTKVAQPSVLTPSPVILLGVDVSGRPNFTTLGAVAQASIVPGGVVFALNRVRYALKGIKENMTFSFNIPNTALVKETDYCGMATGAKYDKAKECKFNAFYGDVAGAPYIEQCPVNIGCTVEHILKVGSHFLVVGMIKETYVSNNCLTGGRPDLHKIDPFVFMLSPEMTYNKIGDAVGRAFSIGKEIRSIKLVKETFLTD